MLSSPRVRIVVDTNTLILGSLWHGNPARLLDGVKAGKVTLPRHEAIRIGSRHERLTGTRACR